MIDSAWLQGNAKDGQPVGGGGLRFCLRAGVGPENSRGCRGTIDSDGVIVLIQLCELAINIDHAIRRIGQCGICSPTAAIVALQGRGRRAA